MLDNEMEMSYKQFKKIKMFAWQAGSAAIKYLLLWHYNLYNVEMRGWCEKQLNMFETSVVH